MLGVAVEKRVEPRQVERGDMLIMGIQVSELMGSIIFHLFIVGCY